MNTAIKEVQEVAPQAVEGFISFHEATLMEGKAEGLNKAARGMKAEGIPMATIAKITGLSLEEIKQL